MTGLTLLRTAVGSLPSLGLIEELQDHGFRVVGADADSAAYGLLYLDDSYVVPPGDSPEFTDAMKRIAAAEDVNAILPGPESEIRSLSRQKEAFREQAAMVLCPDAAAVSTCIDKSKTHDAFERADVPVPEQYSRESIDFPCVVKPRMGGGSSGVNVAHSEAQAQVYASQLADPIFQEYVEGPEYTVDVLCDRGGRTLSVVPRRRHGVESGKSVTGETVRRKDIIDHCKTIAREVDLFGPACIQCIDGENGLRFIEVNTRFGGGAVLSIQADDSILPNLERLIRGEAGVESDGFRENLVMVRNYTELYAERTNVWNEDE